MIDPVKALLEACEPLSALVADYEAAGIDTDDVILCGRTPWNAQPDEPEPPRILFRDLRALARAASVLREREGGEEPAWAKGMVRNASPADWQPYRRALAEALPAFETLPNDDRQLPWDFAVAVIQTFVRQNERKCQRCERSMKWWQAYRCADCHASYCENCIRPHFLGQDHPPPVPAPIGEDQSDLVAKLMAIASWFEREWVFAGNPISGSVKIEDVCRSAAAHISRTSGSAGREMPTRNQIAWALYDREHERSMHADRVVAKMRGREFKDTMEPFEECADVFLGDADAVLALFPAPGKETT